MDAVRAQSIAEWELVLVDDGSHDASVAIARSYADDDPRIRVFVNERNLGTYGTLERARDRAEAPYVAVLNSDDSWAPTKLARQLEWMDAHPNLPLCYTLGWKMDDDGQIDETEDVHADWPCLPEQELLPYLLYQNRVLASSVLFRRESVAFDYSLRYSGDWTALLSPSRESAVGCVDDRLTFWRMHSDNSFVRSVHQVTEEVRIRRAILDQEPSWFVRRIPARQIRRGLGMNAVALAALEMLRGRRGAAIEAAMAGVRLLPEKRVALRRLAACLMPDGKNRLWPNDSTRFERPDRPLPLSLV